MACPENIQIMADNSDKQSWLLNYLSKPIWLDTATAALRVTVQNSPSVSISGNVTQVTTVPTVTTLNQKGGFPIADTELRWEMSTLWYSSARRCIT
jgi:hypothetical protein